MKQETVRKTTEAEIAAMVAERRAAKAEATKQPNLVTGAIEEAQLIIWPGIGEALINTFVVIAMVTITSAALFGVNTGLASLSTWLYSGNGSKQALAPASEAKPEIVKATSAAAPSLAPPSLAEGRGNVPSTL